jgi:hypothetical protein
MAVLVALNGGFDDGRPIVQVYQLGHTPFIQRLNSWVGKGASEGLLGFIQYTQALKAGFGGEGDRLSSVSHRPTLSACLENYNDSPNLTPLRRRRGV